MKQLSQTERTRILAASKLLGYVAVQFPDYRISHHHRLIANALEAVERGEITRLIITMPPRHGKSMLASEYFPAWYLGRNPENQVIAATYSQDLASTFGRKVRNQLIDPLFYGIFRSKAADDSASASQVMTDKGGVYNAVGVGGALTGRGAHLLLIDDPIKGREEADSELIRRKQREWYNSVAYTRLMPNGAIVIIQTRWHEDDLTGYVLTDHVHEGWVHLNLPAINSAGEALWPEQYPIEQLERIRKTIGAREWNALYQQTPTPAEGIQFKPEWFPRFRLGDEPKELRYYMASDFAVTPDAGDYTEHGVFGLDPQGRWWLVDWWHGQTTPDVWIDRACDLIARWRPMLWAAEAGVIRRAVEPFLMRRMQERRTYCKIEWVPSISDKPTRARSFEARAAMQMVNLPRTEWADRLLDQLLRFPAGKHDDAVDVCSLMALALDSMPAAPYPAEEVKPRRVMRWDEEPDDDLDSWRTL
jgi:predicted phage terminase large subunit-like protein